MHLVRQAVDQTPNRPAILRKEFIFEEYQIVEARLHGADTVLLSVEVKNQTGMMRELELGAKVIDVNNRSLHSFEVDLGTITKLVDLVKEKDVILCALSGISGLQDVRVYKEQSVHAVLVGEALMRAQDTTMFIRELLEWPA
ncbi:hypothetical protein C8J57DRAFT_1255097 [Mycena rebaudengoi]|nr:hypothetical protein C8J57DRAFT_1255097 [Mycena rebaudengoi]